jgi:hypothetical protein
MPSQPQNNLQDTFVSNDDFKFVLDSLLQAYRPILENELRLATSAEELLQDSEKNPLTCQDEIALAQQLFSKFFSPEVAFRLLPAEGQQIFGDPKEWEWCHRHILCCLIFGWLVCRGRRTFRGFAYYLHQYWLCVRQAIGSPVSVPPTLEEKRDFNVLVRLLATAYAPSVKGELRDLEYPVGIPEEIASGAITCAVDDDATDSVFERLLSPDAAAALFGQKALATVGIQNPLSRNCRCYCISALEFGCCLGRAYSVRQVILCLEEFFKRNRGCFNPLTAVIDTPPACASLTFVPACSNLAGLEINGTAAGAAFTSYTLTYSLGGPILNTAVVYPDCSVPPANPASSTAVSSGILGYLNIDLLPPNTTSVTIYLDVYGSGGLHLQTSQVFQLSINAIAISAVATVSTTLAQDPFNPATSIVKLVPNAANPGFELSIGGSISITGSAYADGCGSQMTQYQLAAFGPTSGAIPLPVPVASPTALGGTPIIAPVVYDGTTAHPWSSQCLFGGPTPNIILNGDLVAQWTTENCVATPFPLTFYTIPQISSGEKWPTGPSGRTIVYLEVDEALLSPPGSPSSPAGEDQVVVWIDNYPVTADITAVGNVVGCGDLFLSQYVGSKAVIRGVAWDYPIDINSAQMAPNDNFGSYSLSFQKNGGTPVAFLPSDYTPNGTVVATPTVRVPNLWQSTVPISATQSDILASWDIVTALDGGAPPDPNSPCVATIPSQIPRGCHCAYIITLGVSDTTWVGDGGANHPATKSFALNIINDIPNP